MKERGEGGGKTHKGNEMGGGKDVWCVCVCVPGQ